MVVRKRGLYGLKPFVSLESLRPAYERVSEKRFCDH